METIKVTVDGNEFEFKTEQNVTDERRIFSIMAELLGGWENAAQLETSLNSAYQKHRNFNSKKFGEEEYKRKSERYFELSKSDTNDQEYLELKKELSDNIYWNIFSNLQLEKTLTWNYAWMQVMCIKPSYVNLLEKQESFLLKLWAGILDQKITNKEMS